MLVVDPLGYGTRTPRSSLRHPDDKNCLARGRGIRVQGRERQFDGDEQLV